MAVQSDLGIGSDVGGTGAQSTLNRASAAPPGRVGLSWSGDTVRSARRSTEATGAPVTSASWSDTVPFPADVRRTRTVSAPTEWTRTPVQEKGRPPLPGVS